MPESAEHAKLVAILRGYISERFCEGNSSIILCDSVNKESRARPPSIEGYVPDAYVLLDDQGKVVIGEAKSIGDLENAHTDDQIMAFLTRCGTVKGSAFILAVPWPVERLARSLLTNFQASGNFLHVETVVLSEVNAGGAGTKA